ncbi:outer membrane protein assembly factor BamA [Candidatus Liberibacter africanus]|uniref:outer membrane protein assembly factor BamA n=1 Tax=Liberibacter africanus TaxID=34020 RepID=UPI0006416753|nr:outer membrane protein assembly factor BamA [Candidatus Liberibacter africanus]QTP63921.1 outer membrane protein assembly factor BamA [Candidatus Liberibacter africanus]
MYRKTKYFCGFHKLLKRSFSRPLVGFFVFSYVFFAVSVVYGSDSFVVNDIKIRGAVNVSKQIILSHIPITVGKSFSEEDLDSSVKNLYAIGYFSNVKINVVNSVLIINLVEKQIINHLFLSGNDNLKDDNLRLLIHSRDSFGYDEYTVKDDVRIIKEAYASRGYLNVVVNVKKYSISPTRINLTYAIDEGFKTTIDSIRFKGNNSYSQARLKSVISLKTSGFFLFGEEDVYSKERMSYDEESIRKFYYDRGYAAVKVSSRAFFDKAKNSYSILFDIDEGRIYRVGNITIKSTLQDFTKDMLLSLVQTRSGDVYDPRKIEESTENISKNLFFKGKYFVRTNSRINRDFAKGIVDIEYIINYDSPLYIERIEIEGNSQSHDSVIRRELDFSEGDPISLAMIERAKRRIMATGYFSKVNILKLPANVEDRVVLRVIVEQLSSGSIGLSTNYTVNEGTGIEGFIADNNFFGRGYRARISLGVGHYRLRNYVFSFENPYFLGSRISSGFDIRRSSFMEGFLATEGKYGSVYFTFPITEKISTTSSYNYKALKYSSSSMGEIHEIEKMLVNHGEFSGHSISQDIVYNTLDSQVIPREGIFMKSMYDYAGLRGDSKYHLIKYGASYFNLLSDNYDIVGSLKFGYSRVIPVDKNLQVFDQLSTSSDVLRGFADRGIGPRVNGYAIGGNTSFSASASVSFPMPIINPQVGLRGVFFVDSATLYGNDFHLDISKNKLEGNDSFWRVATGAEIAWDSPIGAISLYYGIPLRKQSYDTTMRWGIQIGNRFR